jgi:AraC family transcriptional regulator
MNAPRSFIEMLQKLPRSLGAAGVSVAGDDGFLLQGDEVSLNHCWQPPVRWSEHTHPEVQIMILFSPASCRMRWDSGDKGKREHRVEGPAIIVLPPKLVHAPEWETEAELVDLYVNEALFSRLTGGNGVLSALTEPWIFHADDFFLWQTFSSLRYFLRANPRPDRSYIDAVGCVVIGHLVWRSRHKPQLSIAETVFSPQKLRKILAHIHANIRGSVGVEDLAKQAGISRAHFAEVFKNSTGSTPYDYLIQCRLVRAQELLSGGDLRISEVAEASGFYDQSHLSRHFRKILGLSPREYVARMRGVPVKRTR